MEESAIEDDDEQDLDEALSSVSSQYDTDLDEPPMVSTSGPSPVKEDDVEVLIAALRKAPPGRIKPIFWKRLAARVCALIPCSVYFYQLIYGPPSGSTT